MFDFTVKDMNGVKVAAGTNDAHGNINFSKIELSSPGTYVFVVEEVKGIYSGVTYDGSQIIVVVTVTDDGNGNLIASTTFPTGDIIFNNTYITPAIRQCQCSAGSANCRKSIKGQKIWIDDNNQYYTRPESIDVLLLREGVAYKRITVSSENDWNFSFCCLPIGKNSKHKYNYTIDEATVPVGYTKKIEGYNIINTLIT